MFVDEEVTSFIASCMFLVIELKYPSNYLGNLIWTQLLFSQVAPNALKIWLWVWVLLWLLIYIFSILIVGAKGATTKSPIMAEFAAINLVIQICISRMLETRSDFLRLPGNCPSDRELQCLHCLACWPCISHYEAEPKQLSKHLLWDYSWWR